MRFKEYLVVVFLPFKLLWRIVSKIFLFFFFLWILYFFLQSQQRGICWLALYMLQSCFFLVIVTEEYRRLTHILYTQAVFLGVEIYRFSYWISHLRVVFLPFISLKIFLNIIFKLDSNGNCTLLCLHPSPTLLCKFNSSLTRKFQQNLCLYMFLLDSEVIYLIIFIKIFSLWCR